MNEQNTNYGDERETKKQEMLDSIKKQYPDLEYEEIEDYDRALDDYLNICVEMYWARVKDGTFPWPDEHEGICDYPDSTLQASKGIIEF